MHALARIIHNYHPRAQNRPVFDQANSLRVVSSREEEKIAIPVLRTNAVVCELVRGTNARRPNRSGETSTPNPRTTDRRVRRRLLRSNGCFSAISRSAAVVVVVEAVVVAAVAAMAAVVGSSA